jgi:hypothetical protein
MLTGGCFCGAIRYETPGSPYHEVNCYCSMCRRTAGAPLVAWFTVSKEQFRFTQGDPVRFQSSSKAIRKFCGRCGTHLTFENNELPNEIDITICSLDDPESVQPKKNIHEESRLSWTRTNAR